MIHRLLALLLTLVAFSACQKPDDEFYCDVQVQFTDDKKRIEDLHSQLIFTNLNTKEEYKVERKGKVITTRLLRGVYSIDVEGEGIYYYGPFHQKGTFRARCEYANCSQRGTNQIEIKLLWIK